MIEHDDYSQYFIAVEKNLMLESTNIATALFLLLASHYVFNLSYHTKASEFFIFMQEKIAKIPSDDSNTKTTKKSPIAQSHVRGIAQYYRTMTADVGIIDESMD